MKLTANTNKHSVGSGLVTTKTAAAALSLAVVANQLYMSNNLAEKKRALERVRKLSADDVLIVGCGFSGICAAVKLQEAGIPFRVIEKSSGYGGTWFLNRYPGCACDIPAHLYSFSFERKMDWSEPYAPQQEIHKYLEGVVFKYGIDKHVKLNCGLKSASWNDVTKRWDVTTTTGETMHPKFLINAIGALHHPQYPDVPGMDTFEGQSMHSAEWHEDVDLKDKRIAVIGSAASAVQVVPHLAKVAKQVNILQRTPNWVSSRIHPLLPREKYSSTQKWMFENIPLAEKLHRLGLYLSFEFLFWPVGVFDKDGLGQRAAQTLVRREMCKNLKHDKDLIEKVVPKYGIGCKRICRTDDYLPALTLPHVNVIPHGLKEVGKDYVVASNGEKVEADVIIYATGFHVGSIGKDCTVQGKDGKVLSGTSAAEDALESYLGLSTPNFPNMFTLLGANTGLGHNSVVLMIESQAEYMVRMLSEAIDGDIGTFEVKPEIVENYYKWLWKEFDKRVWKFGGCQSWYKNKDGKIFALWPGPTYQYFSVVRNAPDLRSSYNLGTDRLTSHL